MAILHFISESFDFTLGLYRLRIPEEKPNSRGLLIGVVCLEGVLVEATGIEPATF